MSHHKHTTEAFVLSVTPSREHDVKIKMVTKDGEVLTAIATGMRTLRSKLRMAVMPYAHVTVSIVKGKDVWRLTNAQSLCSFYAVIAHREARKALARTVSLVEKLTPGEANVGIIFEILVAYAHYMTLEKTHDHIKAHETQAALRILAELGHIEDGDKWKAADVTYVEMHITEAVRVINQGIASTHLA